jgi:hypothetical protein
MANTPRELGRGKLKHEHRERGLGYNKNVVRSSGGRMTKKCQGSGREWPNRADVFKSLIRGTIKRFM